MDQKKLEIAEEFLERLEWAWACMPATAEPRLPVAMDEVLTFARSMVASALDPNTVTEIRHYSCRSAADHMFDAGFEGKPLLRELLGYLLEKAHDGELDPSLECFDILREMPSEGEEGIAWIVGGFAQVETAPELFAWLYARIPVTGGRVQ
jgi:hypothetical protein